MSGATARYDMLGRGLMSPLQVGTAGQLARADGADRVRQAIFTVPELSPASV